MDDKFICVGLFPFSLEGKVGHWYEAIPPNLSWDELCDKFLNKLFPNSKINQSVATCLRGEAHGCAFQRRKDVRSCHQRLFVENVGKNRRKPVKTKILSSGVVFTFKEGIAPLTFVSKDGSL